MQYREMTKGQSHRDSALLQKFNEGVGIDWKSTNSFPAMLKRTVLVTEVVKN